MNVALKFVLGRKLQSPNQSASTTYDNEYLGKSSGIKEYPCRNLLWQYCISIWCGMPDEAYLMTKLNKTTCIIRKTYNVLTWCEVPDSLSSIEKHLTGCKVTQGE